MSIASHLFELQRPKDGNARRGVTSAVGITIGKILPVVVTKDKPCGTDESTQPFESMENNRPVPDRNRVQMWGGPMTDRSQEHWEQMTDRSQNSQSTATLAECAESQIVRRPRETLHREEDSTTPRSGSDEIVSYIPALRIYARSLTRNAVDADDLVQETLLRAVANIQSYQTGSNMRAWLVTIMRNRFYTNCVKKAREPTGGADCISTELAAELVSNTNSQIWHLKRLELERALLGLPLHYREAIFLVGVLGESYKSASIILDCDIGTIKSRVSRARATLSQVLDAPLGD